LICELLHESRVSFSVDVGSIKIEKPIKSLGQYIVSVNVFADIIAKVRLNVCRTSTEFDSDVESFDKKYQEFLQPTNANADKIEVGKNAVVATKASEVGAENIAPVASVSEDKQETIEK